MPAAPAARPKRSFPPSHRNGRRAERAPGPIRIGHSSSDFYDHATMALFAGVLEAQDRETLRRLRHLPHGGGPGKGPARERFLEAIDFYIDILSLDDDAAAELVLA